MNADANRPATREAAGGTHDGEAAPGCGQHRFGVRAQQVGRGKHGVADGVDLLQPMRLDQVLAGTGKAMELGHHFLGRMAVAVAGKADNVGKQDGHVLEPSGCNSASGLQLG